MPVRAVRLILLSALACCAPAPPPAPIAIAINVEAHPIPLDPTDPAKIQAGRLRFLGGLHLQSGDRRFGGISGLRWHQGRLYAVTDAGDWLVLEVKERGDRLTGIGRVRIQRLIDGDGEPITGKARGDAEALHLNYDECPTEYCDPQSASIAFEQDHRIWTYDLQQGLPVGRPVAMNAVRDWIGRLPANGGVEAMAGIDSLWLMVSEQSQTASGAARALLIHNGLQSDAAADRWQEAEIPTADDFRPTDADYLDGGFLLLFRRYSLMHGVAARVERARIVTGSDGKPRILMQRLAELVPPVNVDNMEGLAVRQNGDRVFVYLVSDDNFSGAQRTLLMKFELMPKR